jgi:acetyl esterase/lipase
VTSRLAHDVPDGREKAHGGKDTMRWARLLAATLVGASACAGDDLVDGKTFRLWPGRAPEARGSGPADTPVVQVFVPAPGVVPGSSIVVCPGGGYGGLTQHEGAVIGRWLAMNGVTAFVLRYRVGPKYHHPIELGDALRAIRFVRSRAEAWKLDPKRIGIMGFSAGGHLASSAATHHTEGDARSEDPVERVSSRPDVQILIYPVITMGPGTHQGSRNNLLGPNPSRELIDQVSSEKHVRGTTPPAFLVHSVNDNDVPVLNSDAYVEALTKFKVPYEYLRGNLGGHGFGLTEAWSERCIAWLRAQRF